MYAEAQSFIPAVDFTLTSVSVTVSWWLGPNSGIGIGILNDEGGPGPGSTVLESWSTGGLPAATFSSIPAPTVVNDALNLQLTAGTQYWIEIFYINSSTTDIAHSGGGSGYYLQGTCRFQLEA